LLRELGPSALTEKGLDPAYRAAIDLHKRGYHHWHQVKPEAERNGLDPRVIWAHLKLGRMSDSRPTPFSGANGTPVSYCVPDQVQRELMHLDQDAAGQYISDATSPELTPRQRDRFIKGALAEEAIASSLLEGAVTTRSDARQMIGSGRSPRTRGERMVANNYKTISFIREHLDRPMSRELLLELQSMLTEGTLDDEKQVGRFRVDGDNVRIEDAYNETVYMPPPAAEIEQRTRTLCAYANHPELDPGFTHPIIRACLLHFQIAVDHPFCDGNGRTARAVFYWYVLRNKYWLFEYMPISMLIREGPSKYSRAFVRAETDSYDATYFLTYKAGIFARARAATKEHIREKLAEQHQAVRLLQADPTLGRRQREVLQRFARDPDHQMSIQTHMHEQQVSYQTARSDLLELADRGYLSSFKDGNSYIFIRGPRFSEITDCEA